MLVRDPALSGARDRWGAAGADTGEGSILLVALVADHLIRRRPLPTWRILIAPAGILALHYTFNRLYYGAFEPATADAKIWQGRSGLWDGELFLDARGYMQSWFFEDKSWLWQGFAALAVVGVLVRIRRALPIVAFAIGYSAFFYLLHIPDYFWYYAPLMFLYFCYAGMGLTDVASLFGRGMATAKAARLTQIGAAVLVGVVLTGFALHNRPRPGTGPTGMRGQRSGWRTTCPRTRRSRPTRSAPSATTRA